MQILIDGRPAVLKSDTSFDYVAENRLFGGADDYSLAITLPLADCPQNLAIFGHINRKDVKAQKLRYDCEIRCADFLKFGTVTITEISEKDIKVQFLAGRSEQNFDKKFDEIYINELTLGSPQYKNSSSIQPMDAVDPYKRNFESVALPWVNNDSGILHNCYKMSDDGVLLNAWDKDSKTISWQPYLLFIIKKICEAIEYSCDISELEADNTYKYLIICNCLPSSWGINDYARALPHWSVAEFFEKLELFLEGEFDIDHRDQKISFKFSRPVIQSLQPVRIDKVVDTFTAQIKKEQKSCEYLYSKNIAFKECDFNMSKFYSCDETLKSWKGIVRSFDTLSQLMAYLRGDRSYIALNGGIYSMLCYAKDVDMNFIVTLKDESLLKDANADYFDKFAIQPINMYGGRIVSGDDDSNKTEIEFVPANIDFTEIKYGYAIFLQPSGFNESADESEDNTDGNQTTGRYFPKQSSLTKPVIQDWFEKGSKEETAEYYDAVYIAFWNGQFPDNKQLLHPFVSNIYIDKNWTRHSLIPFNFRLNDKASDRFKPVYDIDPTTKVTFKFLADSIPNPRALFFIQGQRYVCEKITATFTESGMSQLLKGEFYPVVD